MLINENICLYKKLYFQYDTFSFLQELRISIKLKQEELSEMTIRKELAEKKLGNVNKDYELTIEKLQVSLLNRNQ